MPSMPPVFRPAGYRTKQQRKREYDARRRAEQPWRKWYSLSIWQDGIRPKQLIAEPLCRRCNAKGLVVLATVVNHVEPHRGDWDKFVSGPFESLCKTCHDVEVQREERAAQRTVSDGR